MSFSWRVLAAGAILYFAFAGLPKIEVSEVITVPPSSEETVALEPLSKLVPSMFPYDRDHLNSLYEAMGIVLSRDARLDKPLIETTEDLAVMHADTLRLAIDQEDIGKVPGLGKAIDSVFAEILGPEVAPLSGEKRRQAIRVCELLSWKFQVGRG
tara:strand:+ start:7433 stop:7897 length:465 start_codon:yes stop_codon:yes gene_type:complete